MSSEATDERSEVHCFVASLSVHDLDDVGGELARAGLRLTIPNSEKDARPFRTAVPSLDVDATGFASLEIDTGAANVIGQGVASAWCRMVNSMLASPQGASEQYMRIFQPSLISKGGTGL